MRDEQVTTEDEGLLTAWWNGLTERARALWLQRAGSNLPADAWTLFQSNPAIAFEIGLQEGTELSEANADNAQFGPDGLTLYLHPAGQTRH